MLLTKPRLRCWTRDEYRRLGDLGFFQGQRVELINGRIVKMSAMKNNDAVALGLAEDVLRAAFGKGHWVRVQLPLALSPASEPEPDLAVVPGGPRDYSEHPATAMLVVEVSDTTLGIDRGAKAKLYARAAIADYWIVNLVDRKLEVYRAPKPAPVKRKRLIYSQVTTFAVADSVTPLAAPQAKIAVADLLP